LRSRSGKVAVVGLIEKVEKEKKTGEKGKAEE